MYPFMYDSQKPILPSDRIFLIPLWVHFSYFLFAYIRIEIRVSIYYMYGLTATRKNTRNNSFSVSKMKKDKFASHYSLSFYPILHPRHSLERIFSLL